jgi:E3 ubiquitin-protein ligase synoviolin
MTDRLVRDDAYRVSAYELRRAGQRGGENAPPWENKSMWVFYIELATGLFAALYPMPLFTNICQISSS